MRLGGVTARVIVGGHLVTKYVSLKDRTKLSGYMASNHKNPLRRLQG